MLQCSVLLALKEELAPIPEPSRAFYETIGNHCLMLFVILESLLLLNLLWMILFFLQLWTAPHGRGWCEVAWVVFVRA